MTINPFSKLPKDVAFSIFGQLPLADLARCCEVSKTIKSIAENDQLWEKPAHLLEIPKSCNYRFRVCTTIKNFKKLTATIQNLLKIKVKPNAYYDRLSHSMSYNDRLHAASGLQAKRKNKQRIFEGILALIRLKRLGLSTTEKVETYSKTLTDKYETRAHWVKVAEAYVAEGNDERANQIIDSILSYPYLADKCLSILRQIIDRSCKSGDFNNAFSHLRKMLSYDILDSTIFISKSIDIILLEAKKQNNPSIEVNLLKEGLIPKHLRRPRVCRAIQNCLKRADTKKARALFNEYLKIPDAGTSLEEMYRTLERVSN